MIARSHTRRLLALLALAWGNLLVQPCLAYAPAEPPGMEHCDHGNGPAEHAPCLEMTADDCVASHDANLDAPRSAELDRTPALTEFLPLPARARGASADRAHAATAIGPPLIIRYCNLRN